jgi:phospho-N-acetylmuramoyl-pentapeptide-transferase
VAILQLVKVLGTSLIAFVVAILGTPFLVKFLARFQLHKQIRTTESAPIYSQLHKDKKGTPTAGGIIIWLTVIGLAVLFWILSLFFDGFWGYLNFVDRGQTYLPLFSMAVAALLGLFDDVLGIFQIGPRGGGLNMRQKLLMYGAVALMGALWFYYRLEWDVISVPLIGTFDIGWLYVPIFLFIITASAFSANEADGLDGLAGGVLLFAFAALTTVAFALGRYQLATLGGAIIGALLAFLWFNIYPARFFMGDTGAMSLGITMGVIAMLTNTALLLPFFAPILVLESASVIIQLCSKKFFGRKIFLSTPIHHHFEALGWHETKVTMRFWIISVIFMALGLIIFFLNRFL